MKTTLIVILFIALVYVFSEFDLSLKDNSFTLRYLQPMFYETLETGSDLLPADSDSTGSGEQPAEAREAAELRRVIDGDTIDVLVNGEIERVRYIAANSPEFGEPCYQQASLANRGLVEGQALTLGRDETDRDDNGRLLRYVYANGVLVERQLISLGFAEVVRYRSDDNFYDEFRELEQQAAEQGLGCHPTGIFDDGSFVR